MKVCCHSRRFNGEVEGTTEDYMDKLGYDFGQE